MRHCSLAAIAAILLLFPGQTFAETLPSGGVRSAQARAPKPHSVILSVMATPVPVAATPAAAGVDAARLVAVDGQLVEMDEAFLRAQLAAGAFAVVYPGTTIRWEPGDNRLASYPPAWF